MAGRRWPGFPGGLENSATCASPSFITSRHPPTGPPLPSITGVLHRRDRCSAPPECSSALENHGSDRQDQTRGTVHLPGTSSQPLRSSRGMKLWKQLRLFDADVHAAANGPGLRICARYATRRIASQLSWTPGDRRLEPVVLKTRCLEPAPSRCAAPGAKRRLLARPDARRRSRASRQPAPFLCRPRSGRPSCSGSDRRQRAAERRRQCLASMAAIGAGIRNDPDLDRDQRPVSPRAGFTSVVIRYRVVGGVELLLAGELTT